jgi:hypothetical protein
MVPQGAHSMVDRMIGASRLDVHIFEEVEADTSATRQALSVVFLVALATGIASIGSGGPPWTTRRCCSCRCWVGDLGLDSVFHRHEDTSRTRDSCRLGAAGT